MIIVDKAKKTTINIPKNSLGNMTYNKPNADLSDYYTKEEVDELIENVEVDLTNYYTKEEIDNIVENTTIPYLVINQDWNGYESGDFESVRQAIGDKKPYFIYAPAPLGGYFSPNYAEQVFGQINCHFFYHTDNGTNYYYFVYLHNDEIRKNTKTLQYATTSDLLKYGVNGLIVNYNEEFNEYTYNGVDFSALKQAIESGNKLYSIYLPSSDNTYKIAAQEIVVNDNEIRCITIENNGDTQITTNWTIRFDDDYFEMYITKGDSYTKNIATQDWIEQQGYLTSIPDEYITESELETKLEEVDFSLPTVKINWNTNTYDGDIEGVIDGILNNKPVNVLMHRNNETYYSATHFYIQPDFIRTYCYYNYDNTILRVYTQINRQTYSITSSTNTRVPLIVDNLTSTSTTSVLSANMGRVLNETKQDTLVSGENIKTINGESILGEGNIEISGGTTDLSDYYTKTECDGKFQLKGNYLTSVPDEYVTDTELTNKGYATTTYVDTQIGNINTILENIIG